MLKVMVRGLRSRLVRLLLTALVVVMGVAFVSGSQLLTDTVKQGFDRVFSSRYAGTDAVVRSSDSLFTFGGQQRAPIRDDVLATAGQAAGVGKAAGVVQAPVRLLGKDGKGASNPGTLALQTFGLNWIDDSQLNRWRLSSGRPPQRDGEVVIDEKFAADKGFTLGDRLNIPFAQGTVPFTVVGIAGFQSNPNYSGSTAVLFDTATAQKYLVGERQFNWIALTAKPGVSQSELRAAVQRSVTAAGPLQVLTGAEFTREDQDLYQRALGAFNQFLQIFAYVALFVSIFVIYNTFSVVVAQRARELALLRAMGAGRRQIIGSMTAEAAIVGVLASLFGVGAGIAFGWLILALLGALGLAPIDAALATRPVSFLPAFLAGVVVTIAAALLPAWRASRIPPVAALRDHVAEPAGYTYARVAIGAFMVVSGTASMLFGLAERSANSVAFVGIGMAVVFLGTAVVGPILVRPASAVLGSFPVRWKGITGLLARENARRNPKRTSATTTAVMIAVALVAMISVFGESLRAATAEAVDLSVVGDLVVNASTVGLAGVSPEVTRQLNEQPEVQAAASLRVGVALADGRPSLFFGVDPARLQQVVKFDVASGSLDDLGTDGIAVAQKIADDNRLAVGSPVLVHFLTPAAQIAAASATPTTAGTGGGSLVTPAPEPIGDRVLKVRAIFDSELLRGSAGYLVSQQVFEQGFPAVQNTDLQVYVKLAPGVSTAVARERLEPVVARFPPAELQDLTEFKRAQSAPIDRVVTFIWALLLMAVLISAIGILNTLLLSVYERIRELGLLRAAGMSREQVRTMVRWEAVIISIMGTLAGLVIGVLFAWALVRALAEEGLRTFAIPTVQLVVVVVLAGMIGVVAAIVPARRAANLDVLQAIATE